MKTQHIGQEKTPDTDSVFHPSRRSPFETSRDNDIIRPGQSFRLDMTTDSHKHDPHTNNGPRVLSTTFSK